MTIDLTQIILAFLSLVFALIARYIIPWLKSKIDVENGKVTENQAMLIKMAIKTAVTAAEQLYTSAEGEKKKSYVINILESQGYTVDKGAIDSAIEAAVYELHHRLDE